MSNEGDTLPLPLGYLLLANLILGMESMGMTEILSSREYS